MPLADMLDAYIKRRTDLKSWSIKMLQQARGKLVGFFGQKKPIGAITAGDAADFKRAMTVKLSTATVAAKLINLSRQFFKDAIAREILDKSPFVGIKSGSQKNPARKKFVARETIMTVIAATNDIEWKVIIAQARFGGLRIPTELVALRWEDIGWDTGRMRIRASKTEHHVGHEERDTPLFPELRSLLLELRKITPPDAVFVVNRYRNPEANLRSAFLDLLEHASVKPWPKLFQNLRSTRQTELTEIYAAHVVCAWLGNCEKVAKDH